MRSQAEEQELQLHLKRVAVDREHQRTKKSRRKKLRTWKGPKAK